MRSLVGMFLPLFCVVDLETSNGLMPAAGELMMLNRLLINPGVQHAIRNIGAQFGLARSEAQRVYGAARESDNECKRITLKYSTCSHKWWETLKFSIFGVKPSIPALRGPRGGVVVAHAEKASLLGSQFDSKQCREQFVNPLSCFPEFRCNSLAFRTSVLLRLLLDLDTYGGVEPLGALTLFLKKVADIIAPKLSITFHKFIRLGSLPQCWRSANVTAILKGAPSPDMKNYRPVPITPILSRCLRS